MSPSKRFINWTNASFTPAGGTVIPILGITQCTIDRGVTYVMDSADADFYDSLAAAVGAKPKATIATNRPGILDTVPVGVIGVFSIQRNDAINGGAAGGGAVIYSLTGVFDPATQAGAHHQIGTGGGSFVGVSADGTTNPLSVAVV